MEQFTMNNGLTIPAMGFGVFMMSSAEVKKSLPTAIELGYRHIDTANAYFNEVAVGEVVRDSSLPREDFFITTKLFPQNYSYEECKSGIDASLRRLDMEYVDLMLLHQPYGAYTEAWRALEEAQAEGKIRSIGLSNFNKRKFQEVLDAGFVTPQVLQIEVNPRWNQHDIKAWLEPMGVIVEGWYPLGHGDKALIDDPFISEIAARHGKTNSQIILRWHIQEGNVVFPKTTNPIHMAENLDIFDFALTDEEVARINSFPQKAYYDVAEEAPTFVTTPMDFDQQQ